MVKPLTKKDIDILETGGLWEASSYIVKLAEKRKKKNAPLRIGDIKYAHSKIFEDTPSHPIGGNYRKTNNVEVKRTDGTLLATTDWRHIPSKMAELDDELKNFTSRAEVPRTEEQYYKIIHLAAKMGHALVCIHPFENGNGRASRLLVDAISIRMGLRRAIMDISKQKYRKAMFQADNDNLQPLENLISHGLLLVEKRIYDERRRASYIRNKKRKFRK